MRQLNNYNLRVYGFHDRTGYYYLSNECIARRGASDIVSCVMKYLEGLNRSGSINTVNCYQILQVDRTEIGRSWPYLAVGGTIF